MWFETLQGISIANESTTVEILMWFETHNFSLLTAYLQQ